MINLHTEFHFRCANHAKKIFFKNALWYTKPNLIDIDILINLYTHFSICNL